MPKEETIQEIEIKTIKERNLKIKLSTADCQMIFELCGRHDITVEELLENFIGDLVGGTYSNGSDERDYARAWFERCWFSTSNTLISWLQDMYYEVYDDFLMLSERIENNHAELEDYLKGDRDLSEEKIEDIKTIKNEINEYEEKIEKIKTEFLKTNLNANWNEEVKKVKLWWKKMEYFIDETIKNEELNDGEKPYKSFEQALSEAKSQRAEKVEKSEVKKHELEL